MRPSLKENDNKITLKEKIAWPAVLFVLLYSTYSGLAWLGVSVVVLYTLFILIRKVKFIGRAVWLQAIILFFAVTALSILTRIFLFEIFTIPSESMEDTLFSGDNVIVSKLSYGPKIPQSPMEISWINLFYHHTHEKEASSTIWPYRRLGGFSKVGKGDIVVFRDIENRGSFLVKRCQALPGDMIVIKNNNVSVNDRLVSPPDLGKLSYRLWFTDRVQLFPFLRRMHIQYTNESKYHVDANIGSVIKDELLEKGIVDSVKTLSATKNVYPWDRLFKWSASDFGPVYVPRRGMVINLTPNNFILYEKIINEYERAGIHYNGKIFLQNGKAVCGYTFKQNYYFMLGDNRSASIDSRFWGFLPEANIEGKAIGILYYYNNGFRWSRFLNRL